MEEIDLLIIGGGVIGLACACETASPKRTVCLLERHQRLGTVTSTHNSGVIHSGIYYPTGSLKAKLCLEGREALYGFCAQHHVPHQQTGKLILAEAGKDSSGLQALLDRGLANGVENLEIIAGSVVTKLEPNVAARSALWSPSTGIVDTEALVRTLQHKAENQGVIILPAMPLIGGNAHQDWVELHTPVEAIRARTVINAAGLEADNISAILGGLRFHIYPCRGEYAELDCKGPEQISRPVYPEPIAVAGHLGVHLTPTTWGTIMIGPTSHYQEAKDDYESERIPVEEFLEPTRNLLPSVQLENLRLGSSGIRAKLSADPTVFSDFLIERDPKQQLMIHAAGIDSPGLTACIAIARRVAKLVDDVLN
ncbi:MAG: FAD-dependent oxidoreductase [Acidobacteria bacterium]|nr:FAD-dependent oxidoreductase [Acidobacteriota bacterium]